MTSQTEFDAGQFSNEAERENETASARAAGGQQREGLVGSLMHLGLGAAERYASDKKAWLADMIIDLAAGVRRSGRRFEGEQEWLAEAIDKGAGRARDFAEDLRDADVRELYDQGRAFARQRPRLVIAGALTAGIIAIGVARRALATNLAPRAARAA
jgi:hypothetical protein